MGPNGLLDLLALLVHGVEDVVVIVQDQPPDVEGAAEEEVDLLLQAPLPPEVGGGVGDHQHLGTFGVLPDDVGQELDGLVLDIDAVHLDGTELVFGVVVR